MDPDQTSRSAASDLGVHCLLRQTYCPFEQRQKTYLRYARPCKSLVNKSIGYSIEKA